VKEKKLLILRLLDKHRVMALATNRPDGWPQVTQVGYVNDGFLLYCFIARNSQKHANILLDPRISASIGSDAPRPLDIEGLSLAGRAAIVADQSEFAYASRLRLKRYPEYAVPPPAVPRQDDGARIASRPPSDGVILLRIAPELFSVLDYSRGFGHSDLIAFSDSDLELHVSSLQHRWDINAH
jgi:nitroimidazol reductase NimA-like FMN-containing flavoprotein (pyridoxamine 5'-phosphate oxidase superfamily)